MRPQQCRTLSLPLLEIFEWLALDSTERNDIQADRELAESIRSSDKNK